MVTDLAESYAACARFARDHYENFPVASRLLPRAMRPHVAAVYAFARVADDFADEGRRPQAERLALLDAWRDRLHACVGEGAAAYPASDSAGLQVHTACVVSDGAGLQSCALPAQTPHIFAAVGSTIRTCHLPASLFDDLLSAFRQDVTTTRYDTWDGVLDYCRRSANPVGRLVLGIAGYRDDRLDRASDAVCTALQLTNFWQDLERDWQNGRLYLPLEDCRREGADVGDLDARRMTPAWRQVLRGAGARTAALFDEGRSVCDGVRGRLRLEIRFTWLGGRRILSRLEREGFDVFHRRPALGAADSPALLWHAMTWRTR
jgi:hydroxysqualene synthase